MRSASPSGRPDGRRWRHVDDRTRARPDADAPSANRHRSPWMWVSALLLLACAGLLIWALTLDSDLESTQKDVQALQTQLDENEQQGATVGAALQAGYEALMGQIGATQADVDATAESIDQAKQTDRAGRAGRAGRGRAGGGQRVQRRRAGAGARGRSAGAGRDRRGQGDDRRRLRPRVSVRARVAVRRRQRAQPRSPRSVSSCKASRPTARPPSPGPRRHDFPRTHLR